MKLIHRFLAGLIVASGLVSTAGAVEFTEVPSSTSGLNHNGESWGASWGDLNGDRYPDIYASNHRARPSIWRNNGDGSFSDIVLQFDSSYTWLNFPFTDTHGGAWGDFDNDGDADLLVLTGVNFPPELFVNNGFGLASDETVARSMPDDREGRLPTWYDYDNDGLLDVVINNRAPNIFLSQNAGMFSDITSTVGLGSFRTNFGVLSDIDNDNQVELFGIGEGDFPEKVYEVNTVPFTDITATVPTTGLAVDAAVADFNNDLLPDILLVRGFLRPDQALKITDSPPGGVDRIESWHAGGPGSGEKGIVFQGGGVLTVTIYSQLGLPKFFIGSNGYHPTAKTFQLDPNLISDQGIKAHIVSTDQGFYAGYDPNTQTWQILLSPGTSSTRDYVVVEGTDLSDPVALNLSTGDLDINPKLFLNTGAGGFVDTSGIGLSQPVSCVATSVGDFDNDMDIDIYMVCRHGIENISNRLYLNNGDGTFTEATSFGAEGAVGAGLVSGAGVGENVVTADYDVDGWLDLYVLNGLLMNPIRVGGPDQLFRNTTGNSSTNRWVEVDLVGTVSNRDAIGAKVLASAGGLTQLREENGNYHRWSQNFKRIHFGLGQNDTVDIQVSWPNGDVDNFAGVAADQLYEITQGTSGSGSGAIAAVTPGIVPAFPPPQAGDECGVAPADQPDGIPYHFDPAQDRGLFIWKDCATSGGWFARATGGNGDGIEYAGQVLSDEAFATVTPVDVEAGNDIVDNTDPASINYFLRMSGSGVDGFDFTVNPGADVCVKADSLPPASQVMLGRDHLPVSLPLDLNTLSRCIEISAADLAANESDGTASFTVDLSEPSSSTVTVDYAVIPGTATEGADYSVPVSTGTLTYSPTETSKQVQITLLPDSLAEGPETLSLVLSNSNGAFVFDRTAQLTINDGGINPCAAPIYDKPTEKALFAWKDCTSGDWYVRVTAGGDPAGVTYTGAVTSNSDISNVTGYSLEGSDTLDNTSDPHRVDYTLKVFNSAEDGFQFAPAGVSSTCFRPAGPAGVPILVGPNKQPVTGAFDLATLGPCLNLAIDDVVVNEADGTANFTVSLSSPSTNTVTVDYVTQSGTATGGLDYTEVLSPATLTFNPGETSKQIPITILQDTLAEGDEAFTVELINAVNATFSDASGVGTIKDDEVGACGAPNYDKATEKALFVWKDCQTGEWFVRNTAGGDPAGVFFDGKVFTNQSFVDVSGFDIESSDTLDYTTDPTVIDFLLKVWNNGEDGFEFTPFADAGTCLDLSGPSGVPVLVGSTKFPVSVPFDLNTLGACTSLPVDITINDVLVNEADGTANFTVSLSSPSTNTVTVDYVTQSGTATGGLDYTEVLSLATLTFNPGETSKQIPITILQDTLAEGDETFTVELSDAVNAALSDASGFGAIKDDEIDPCGMPFFDQGSDQGVFLWRDCGTNFWHMVSTAGGALSQITYQGYVASDMAILDLNPNSIETNDVLDSNADPNIVDFQLKMKTTGADGFDFTLSSEAGACFTVQPDSPGGGSVFVGAGRVAVAAPFSLITMGACP